MPAEGAPEPAINTAAHFVVRFSPLPQRPLLKAGFAFADELEGSVSRSTDPGVTRLKLDWWRRELAAPGSSSHPLMRQLAPLAAEPAGQAALQAMLDAAESDVLKRQPEDAREFTVHCEQAGGLATLLSLATGHGGDDALPLGCYVAAVSRIQDLGRRLQRGHNPLPRELGLPADPGDWEQRQLAEACQDLLAPLWEAAAPLLRERAARTLPARRLARQSRATHKLLQREGFPVHRMHVDLTPLGKLWAAWRVR